MQVVRVSSKGQVALPKAVREQLGIHEGTRLKLSIDGQAIRLEKHTTGWRKLRGLAAGVDLQEARRQDKEREWEKDNRLGAIRS